MSKKPGAAPKAPKRPQRRWRTGYAAAVVLAPIGLLLVGVIVWEARRPTRAPSDPSDRVTDVAPQVERGDVPPERRDPLNALNRESTEENGVGEDIDRPAPPDPSSILPDIFPDMHNPPQWNEVRAAPGKPVPPDPNIPPPMEIDPLTGRARGEEGAQPRQ